MKKKKKKKEHEGDNRGNNLKEHCKDVRRLENLSKSLDHQNIIANVILNTE